MENVIDFAGLRDFIDVPLKTYSTGMRARLGYAVAAHLHSDVLLVDEALAVGLVDEVVAPEEVVPKALEWCRHALKLPRNALHTTRNTLREDYAKLFDALAPITRTEMTGVWFSEETQRVLKHLMAQLAAKKK